MRTYLTTYKVEFLSPKAPREWPLEAFTRAIDHLIADEVLARNAASERTLTTIALTEGVHMADGAKPLSRIYKVRHLAEVPGDDPTLLRDTLADLLGVTPRQFEGPWNIIGIEVDAESKGGAK
jgi:hypothetical protein